MTENIPARKWLKIIEKQIKAAALRHAFRKAELEFVEIEAGQIKVKWTSGKQKPCFVKISRPVLEENVWEAVLRDMSKQAGCAAALAEGKWPEAAEAVFRRQGTVIFPGSTGDFQTQCSVDQDSSITCRHTLWAHLLFADQLEEDPRLIFDFLGKPHTVVLEFLIKSQVIKKSNFLSEEIREDESGAEGSSAWRETAKWAKSLPPEPSLWFEKMTPSPWKWKNQNLSEVLKLIAQQVQRESQKRINS